MIVEAYRTVIESLGEATLLVSGKGRLLAWNTPATRLLGMSARADTQSVQSLVESGKESVEDYLRIASGSRQPCVGKMQLRTDRGIEEFRTRCSVLSPRQDDAEAILLLQLQAVPEANTQFAALRERVEALNQEIAKRQKIELDLRAQKEWLQVTLTSIGDAVIITNEQGKVTFLNPIAEALTDWDQQSAFGRPHTDVFIVLDENTRKPVENPITRVLRENRIVNLANNSVLVSRTGREIPIADTAAPINISDRVQGVVLVFHDVSAKRNLQRQLFDRAEKLEVANRRKNTFLAMLAHELRNPLAPISNAVQLLKLNPSLISEVTVILERQTSHLNRLINDLLDVSRITQGKIGVTRELLDLGTLVRQECSDHQPRFEQLDIELTIRVPDEPVDVMADQTRMTQVIGNLLHNAQKFTPRGGQVEVELHQRTSHAWLTVKDSGAGLSPALMAELFEPFTQGDQSLDRKEGGLGLGLALVKGIVDLHGGQVFAESAGEGSGATFTVVLPLSTSATESATPIKEVSSVRKKILLIEDNPDQARSMSLLLELLGSHVHIATDGLEGLKKADELKPDVIICDIGLPKLDGFGVAQRLRENKQTSSTLLIALTGYGQDDFIERAREAGFDRHFLKPMSLQEIEQVIVN